MALKEGVVKMRRDHLDELEKQWAEEQKKELEELEKNPLLAYSTSQLKAELRRRKREI